MGKRPSASRPSWVSVSVAALGTHLSRFRPDRESGSTADLLDYVIRISQSWEGVLEGTKDMIAPCLPQLVG
jgi:hypothetical protein